MVKGIDSWIGRIVLRRAQLRWRSVAESVPAMDAPALRLVRSQARQMRREVDRALNLADARLAEPDVSPVPIQRPLMADWAWRPPFWSGAVRAGGLAALERRTEYCEGIKLFHDCASDEIVVRQVANGGAVALAPFGLAVEVYHFDGTFLSVVIDLPVEIATTLRLNHLFRVELSLAFEKPLESFVRLNVKHGPNTEQIVRELPPGDGERVAEFDLSYSRMNEKRAERAWIELIFQRPAMNRIAIRDLTMSRRPRAEV